MWGALTSHIEESSSNHPLTVFTDMERDVYDTVVSMSSVVAEFHTVSYTQIESSSCLIPEVVWEVKGGVKLPLN
jgi:hypothetical protein